MFYSKAITVAANTTKANASETIMKLTHGIITRVSFRPRPGHVGLCHCQVFYHEHQLFPTNPDDDLHGDSWPIEWNEFGELFSEPHDLKIRAWNDDDTYAHTFDISFALLPKWVAIPYAFTKAVSDILSKLNPKNLFLGRL